VADFVLWGGFGEGGEHDPGFEKDSRPGIQLYSKEFTEMCCADYQDPHEEYAAHGRRMAQSRVIGHAAFMSSMTFDYILGVQQGQFAVLAHECSHPPSKIVSTVLVPGCNPGQNAVIWMILSTDGET